LRDEIVGGIRSAGVVDGVVIALHGAMVAGGFPDPEGNLLAAIRRFLGVEVIIAATLDLHANVSEEMTGATNALVGYKTYPHVDMADTGFRAAEIVISAIRGDIKPVNSLSRRPILAATLKMGTDDFPMGALAAQACDLESRPGILAASVFGGFPMADVPITGFSAVVVTDGDLDLGSKLAEKLSGNARDWRHHFAYRPIPVSEAVAMAIRSRKHPALLVDHSDNAASGGTQDVMIVVKEMLAQGAENSAFAAIRDPEAAAQAASAGKGAVPAIEVGGKTEMPAIGQKADPLRLIVTVMSVTDGTFVPSGPVRHGLKQSMGWTTVLRTGGLDLIVCEKLVEPFDLEVFRSVGIDPTEKRIVGLKSRIHYRGAFEQIAGDIIGCGGIGVASSDLELLQYNHIRRPMFPLDPI
jgi:microcystin degradation protein MlrC